MNLEELIKIRLKKNDKEPAGPWKNYPENRFLEIDKEDYNIGILTGEINNIIVLDVDIKDGGMADYQTYVDQYGPITTTMQTTPRRGIHLIFKYSHSDTACHYLIRHCLKNKAKYRGTGLDIRSNGGYIVSAPSTVYNKSYKLVNNFDMIQEMPESLIYWLLLGVEIDWTLDDEKTNENGEKKTKKQNNIIEHKQDYKFKITDEEIKNIISMLDESFYTDYTKWLIVTSALKQLNKYDIWCEFF